MPTYQIDSYRNSGIVLSDAYGNPLTITNTGTISTSEPTALQSADAWTIQNAGSIHGGSEGIDFSANGSIGNTGTITGGERAIAFNEGDDIATVDNSGFIGATGTVASFGLSLYGGGDFINEATGTVGNAAYGVVIRSASATVDNAGTIDGAKAAIYFGAISSLLIDHAGAVFEGAVVAGTSVTSATIELATGAGAGTLSGLGSQFTGFQTVTIDSGATWDIAGSAAAFGTTTIEGFNTNDQLDLTGLTFNDSDTATLNGSNQLIVDDAGGNITIQMDSAVGGDAFTLTDDGKGGTFVEARVEVSGYQATGVTLGLDSSYLIVTSAGTIFNAVGNGVASGSSATVENAGSIYGSSDGVALGGGEVDNTGTIAGGANGVYLGGFGTVHNSGLIQDLAGYRIYGVQLHGGGDFVNSATGTVTNAVFGAVIRGGAGTIDNAGTIYGLKGAVYMGAADSLLIDHAGAVFEGNVVAGAVTTATIELASGSAAGTLSGLGTQFTGFGTIAIDSGATWDIAGSESGVAGVTIAGFGPNDTIDVTDLTYTAGDTATLSASDVLAVYNADGTSIASVQLSGNFTHGAFSVSGGNGGDVKISENLVRPFSTVFGTYTSGIVLSAGSYTNPVTITGTADVSGNDNRGPKAGAVLATAAWTIDNAGSVIGGDTRGQIGINLDAGGSITNEAGGTISGAYAVAITGGGTVENAGTISGVNASVLFYSASGNRLIIDAGAVFDAEAEVVNGTANTIELTAKTGAGTLSGLGSHYSGFNTVTIDSGATWDIAGSASGFAGVTIAGFSPSDTIQITDVAYAAGDTVTLSASDMLTVYNAGGTSLAAVRLAGDFSQRTFDVSGLNGDLAIREQRFEITGSQGGINLTNGNYSDPITIAQTGTVTAPIGGTAPWTIDNQGLINGAAYKYEIILPGGSIDNSGTIIGGAFGIFLTGVGTVDNSGFVGSVGGKYAFGAALYSGGDFINESSGSVGNDGFGVVLRSASGTVDNAGTIEGGMVAIYFGATDSRLIVHPGAVFEGGVTAGSVVATSTIELASGASAGTLSGLGSEYTGFQKVTIDSGAAWDIVGKVGAFATTAIDGFKSHDTLDLTDLAFNAADTAALNGSNQLVIGDPKGNVTIQLDAGAGGAPFILASDGNKGTDVKVVPVVSAGSTVGGLILTSGLSVAVSSGGTATGAKVKAGGLLTVSSGGMASGAIVSGGSATILGTASAGTVLAGGVVTVSSGGKSIGATVSSGGAEKVLTAGAASGTAVKAGGSMTVSAGGAVVSTTLTGGTVTDLGTASATTISAGGALTVSSSGKSIGTTVSSGGTEKILTGGAASGTAAKAGGSMTVSAGGAVVSTTLSGGTLTDLGTASATTISAGGALTVSSGGKSIGATVSSGGTEKVLAGGTASAVSVKSGGTLVYGGGTITGATVSAGGKETILSGVTASSPAVGSGVSLTVSSGGTASRPSVTSGGTITDLGHTLSATLKGATVAGRLVSGAEIVSSKAVASATTVESGGMLIVSSGGTAVGTVLSGGMESVLSGGIVSGAVTFKGTGDTLSITGTKPATLSISGLVKGDTIDLASFASKSATLSFVEAKSKTSGTLTVTDGALKASVTLFGNYVAAGFKLAADGAGTAITYTSATAAVHGDILTAAHH